jgi:hypothetical protein
VPFQSTLGRPAVSKASLARRVRFGAALAAVRFKASLDRPWVSKHHAISIQQSALEPLGFC